jgi:periplasmic divalent cation tolerance protein
MDLSGFCIVWTTIDDESRAEGIATALLEAKLAACIQIATVQSRYVWRGELARAREFLLSIKARAADFDEIAEKIRALHSYETPEIVAAPILAGDAAYLDWLRRETDRAKAAG